MDDCRENFIRDVKMIVAESGASKEQCRYIINRIISEACRYSIGEASTEISVIENSSEAILRLYLGSIKIEGKADRTIKSYDSMLHRFMAEVNAPLTEVSTFAIRAWLINTQNAGASQRTCECYRAYLSAFYKWMHQEGFIRENPMSKLKSIKYEKVKPRPFSDVELDTLRGACTTLRERAELELLISCGVRANELCQMNREDINFISHEVTVLKGKGGKQRVTYINDVCIAYLQKYLDSRQDDAAALFVNKSGKRVSVGALESDLRTLGEKAKVKNVHPHRCRRTFATALSKRGMDVGTIQQLMGHSNINTTMQYITLTGGRIKNEYERFNS